MSKTKSGLGVYWGGFLYNSCLPLELSLNWCSHNCGYCFANLNDPDREADLNQIINLITNFEKRDSYAAWLLQQGYGVVFSNHVDPFATSNDRYSLKLIELMQSKGIRFSLQSKGGRSLRKALEIIDHPICWYFSVTTLDPEISKQVEPGAPLPEERLALIEEIVSKGHTVCVGINPAVHAWLPDPEALVNALKQAGVWGVWTQQMHLSHKQLQVMSARSRKGLGEEVIKRAISPGIEEETFDNQVQQLIVKAGLQIVDNHHLIPTDYFEAYKKLYPKHFPMMQDFINYCHRTKKEGDLIYWPEFRDFFLPQLPDCGERGLRDHINAMVVPQLLYGRYIPQRMTYEQLLLWIWQIKETLYCPVNIRIFSWAAEWEQQPNGEMGWTRFIDDDELPIVVFLPKGGDCPYIDITQKK